eukprot:TRINITY_DN3731_c0_g1_i1.p1 TRINITY_DN3731_c0_g1~~TRINITY_DN3731_c0_g1_i1.p1  ORF type:complete len:66 (+),score=11.90 TRINITY_DN3731_c0_g1_i1:173-370(+)
MSIQQTLTRKNGKKKKTYTSLIDDIVCIKDEMSVHLYLDPSVRDLIIGNPKIVDLDRIALETIVQ